MSRLRKPTSASMTTTRCFRIASATPRLPTMVVLPTPPLPEVTVITLAAIGPPHSARPSLLLLSLVQCIIAQETGLSNLTAERENEAEQGRKINPKIHSLNLKSDVRGTCSTSFYFTCYLLQSPLYLNPAPSVKPETSHRVRNLLPVAQSRLTCAPGAGIIRYSKRAGRQRRLLRPGV